MFSYMSPPKVAMMFSPTLKPSRTFSLGSDKRYPHFDKRLLLGLFCFLFLPWFHFYRLYPSLPLILEHPFANSTLGLQKIYAIVLPERDDRVKTPTRAANATNLNITILNAVRDEEISKGRWPEGWNEEQHKKGELGCLISHVRTWNKMIANNISSALIIESDADWDMRIKSVMPPVATGMKALIDWPFNRPHHTEAEAIAPYGDSWDILWIGHCGSNHGGNVRVYSWNDSTVPPEDREYTFDIGLTRHQHEPGTRTLYQFERTTCSTAYAISLPGAKKLVEYFKRSNENLDLKLSSVCTTETDMMCLGVWPQIITSAYTRSNIEHESGAVAGSPAPGEGGRDKGTVVAGRGLQFSARVNAEAVLEEGIGRRDWKAEWDTSWGLLPNGTWDIVKLNRTRLELEGS